MKKTQPTLAKLSKEVRAIQRSRRSSLTRADEICAKVLAAFDLAAKSKKTSKFILERSRKKIAKNIKSKVSGLKGKLHQQTDEESLKHAKKLMPLKKIPAAKKTKDKKAKACLVNITGKIGSKLAALLKPAKAPCVTLTTKMSGLSAAAEKTVTDNAAINHRRPVVSNIPVKLTPFLKVQKERLQLLRDSLLDLMASVAKDTLRSCPEGSERSAFGQHQADAGSDAYDKDYALSLLSQEQDAINEIEDALKRVENGTYGTCEMSGKPIMLARLEALPFARYTVECQAELEKQRKYQKNRVPVTSLFGLTDSEEEESDAEEAEEEERASMVIPKAVVVFHPFTEKCLKSAAWIAECFSNSPTPDFEWSCAIIPLCKGFEFEIINRVFEPLKEMNSAAALSSEIQDKDLGKMTKFCSGKAKAPPELGVIAYFLRTAIHSKSRREISVLLRTFLSLVATMAEPNWVIEPRSLLYALEELTSKYRNPSAHTTAMAEQDYQDCRELISKPETGALWRLAEATFLKSKPAYNGHS